MVSKKHRLLSLMLCVLTVMSLLAVGMASASAAAVDTVYCENAGGWDEVYCYMWTGDNNNGTWPGQKMTKGEGNLWSYEVTGEWENIMFNNNNGTKTVEFSYPGNGSCFNNQTNAWTTIDTPTTPTDSTNPTTPKTPTIATTSAEGEYAVYCKNAANWSSVSIYMWNTDSDKPAAWPGKTATNIGDGIWMITVDKEYKNVIFSNGGNNQTGNLVFPGSSYCFNNATNQWEIYDLSMLRITSYTADPASPQYTGVEVKLSMDAAGGEGDLQYKFAVDSTVISDYSPSNTATWTPTKAGTYTLTFSVKDSKGETVDKTLSFNVKDIAAEVKPVVQTVGVTPTNSEKTEIKKGAAATVDITAGGGNTGTKLLFYKVTIKDPNGNIVNVPYYTTKSQYKFTPAVLGTYEIQVSVQGSDNSTVKRSYKYECVNELSAPGALTVSAAVSGSQTADSTVTITAAASGGTAPYTYQYKINGQIVQAYSAKNTYNLTLAADTTYTIEVTAKDNAGAESSRTVTITVPGSVTPPDPDKGMRGDADLNGEVNIKDATLIQKYAAKSVDLADQALKNADADENGEVNVRDATTVQKFVAGSVKW